MPANGDGPARGSAAAAASLRRRRTTGGAGAGAGARGGTSTMLQFYTEEAAGCKMSPNAVLIMSIGFFAVVALLHVFGKLYRTSSN
uniref:Protein transport protein Sec61 subunit beta n=1 Tax=Oryza glaberrima TaxID=4538 RepID=I1R4G0_ORYGL